MLKKIIPIVLFAGLFSLSLQAQDTTRVRQKPFQPEWAFGINGGITLSKISFNPIIQQELIRQTTGGFTARYISERNVGIQVEFNYSLRGWKERTDSTSIAGAQITPSPSADTMLYNNYSRSIAYLEMPILSHFYVDLGKRGRIVFNVGPQLGYCLSEKVIVSELSTVYPRPIPSYYDTKVQRTFDWGLVGGMGFELKTGLGSFLIDSRYYFGLSDIFSNAKSDPFSSSSNQIISVKVAYLFRKL